MSHLNKQTLKNGLRVVTIPQKDALAATFLVLVEAGSKYETKPINGLSHFLEHMCFKGTLKRPTALDVTSELDELGAEYNAFTSQEYTGYYAKALPRHVDKILDIISDIYLNPVFDASEMEKEKGVVIEEINMYEDIPSKRVGELLDELMYGDQPAGWPVGGRKEVIRKLTRDDLLKYRSQHYVASGTLVVVAGNFDEKEVIKKIETDFAKISTASKHDKLKVIEKQNEPNLLVQYKKSEQTHLMFGSRAFSVEDDRRFALDVLADVLGGGMSSRLFQRIREQMGAAYYVGASTSYYTDHGQIDIRVGIDNKRLDEVVHAVLEECSQLKKSGISDKELKRAKDHLSGGLILGLETSDALALFYGGQEILEKKLTSPEEILKIIQGVTAKQIQEAAEFVFQDKWLNLALIGPVKKSDSLKGGLHYL